MKDKEDNNKVLITPEADITGIEKIVNFVKIKDH
jgi:hypothetical protein